MYSAARGEGRMCGQFRAQIVEHFDFIESCNSSRIGIFRPELRPSPLFLRRIPIGKKENLNIRMSRIVPFGFSRCGDQQRGTRLGPSGQIKEIVVGAIAVEIIRSLRLAGREQQHSRVASFAGQGLAAGAIVGIGLTIQRKTKLDQKSNR